MIPSSVNSSGLQRKTWLRSLVTGVQLRREMGPRFGAFCVSKTPSSSHVADHLALFVKEENLNLIAGAEILSILQAAKIAKPIMLLLGCLTLLRMSPIM